MMDASPVILTNAITKSFRHVQALRGVSVRVDRGKITAVVGDNGSGKSTLIKILSGSHRPDSGSICIDGKDYSALSIRQSMDLGIRTVYQDLSLDGGERMKGLFLDRKRMREETACLLEEIRVQIPDLTEPVRNLSGGQRQGLAIARALRSSCRVLLLDEPTAAMGIQESHSALNILRTLRDKGLTQIIVSHNLAQVFDLADFVYVMRSGEVIASAATKDITPEDLRELILYS